jgi:hypothetical protein
VSEKEDGGDEERGGENTWAGNVVSPLKPTKHHETDSNYAAHLLMQSTKHGMKW